MVTSLVSNNHIISIRSQLIDLLREQRRVHYHFSFYTVKFDNIKRFGKH
jgi:hypothetical protein